jgi:hypothetical protein
MPYFEFNFTGLHALFLEAVQRHEPSIAFTLSDGRGKFSFLIFMTTDSKGDMQWNDLRLFIILGCTQKILRLKLLGNHKIHGDFKVRFGAQDEASIRAELGLRTTRHRFSNQFIFNNFLGNLNSQIPTTLPLVEKIKVIQCHKTLINDHLTEYVENASKVYLLGKKELSVGKPREETLRKLYMLDVDPDIIADLINHLKRINWTVAWTDQKPDGDRFGELWAKVVS